MEILWINIGSHYPVYQKILYDSKEVRFEVCSWEWNSLTEQLEKGLAQLTSEGWQCHCKGPELTSLLGETRNDVLWLWEIVLVAPESDVVTEEAAHHAFAKASGLGGFLDERRYGKGIVSRRP